jgi:hypothetical protein
MMNQPQPATMKRTARAPQFVPTGTAFQVEQRTRRVEKSLGDYAAELRWRADRADRLAAKIEANRLAKKTIDTGHIIRAWDWGAYTARYAICKLVGLVDTAYPLENEENRNKLLGKLDPRWAYYYQHGHMPGAAPTLVAPLSTGAPSLELPRSASILPISQPERVGTDQPALPKLPADPIAAAVAIARSARAEDIDWSKEPLTERERKVRALFLARTNQLKILALECDLRIRRLEGDRLAKPASDLQAAIDTYERRRHERQQAENRAEMKRIGDAIDAGEEAA